VTPPNGSLTVVMYHFVQPRDAGPVRGLAHLDVAAFRAQLAHIRRHYTPVSGDEVIRAFVEGAPLPPRAALLTFDDGYRCQYRDALPLLEAAAVPALFFPAAASALDRCVLDVNKIQCILATTPDVGELVATIEAAIDERRTDVPLPSVAELRARCWKKSRWDAEPVVYVKRLLQHALPEPVRRRIVDDLFETRVSADERAFADELYMTVDQLRDLTDRGMTVGAHGDRHLRLPTLGEAEQAREIDGALRVLDALGTAYPPFAYCYANGEYDDRSIGLLRARGCAVAFTTRSDVADPAASDALALPRLDTNDLPTEANA